ncbi:hypothetical protein ACFWYW_46795 [Nonomuraea sp. NPDC059023]|uniref:hypothetical protein n=1 Tax=unclassified Nonomuraea TaxID=2593643 RepID=UPI0036C989B0
MVAYIVFVYVVLGYLWYVPGAVTARTERLISEWERDAAVSAMLQRTRMLSALIDQLPLIHRELGPVEGYEAVDQERSRIMAIPSDPAPVAELRRKAALGWPRDCVVWLPILTARLAVAAHHTVAGHVAKRAPWTVRQRDLVISRLENEIHRRSMEEMEL